MNQSIKPVSIYGIFVWILSILFFLYEYAVRMVPATISNYIIDDLKISASQFALIGSSYYITYSLMQLPVGILLDRYGIRLFLSIASLICSIGVFGFALSNSFISCVISRLLTGFGSSFGFVAMLLIALRWLPHKHFGFLAGLAQFLGAFGPIAAGTPVIYFMRKFDNNWSYIFYVLALFGIILSLLIMVFVRDRPKENVDELIFVPKEIPLKKGFKLLMKIPQFWIVLPYAGLIYVSLPLIGAYWGVLYLQTRGFSPYLSSFLVPMIWVGLAIGSPLVGFYSDRIKRRKPFLVGLGILGFFASLFIVLLPIQNWALFAFLFLILGFASAGQSLSFATIVELTPVDLKATAIGANNTSIMLFAAIFPPLITMVIQASLGTRTTFMTSDFTMGFLAMPICYLLAVIISFFFIEETFCHQQNTVHYL